MKNFISLLALVAVAGLQLVTPIDAANIQRVVGNPMPSHITQFPFEVSIRRRFCDACAYEHYCSGTIYSSKVVITARSCVKDAVPQRTHIVAATNKRSATTQEGEMYLVEGFVEHQTADIALIHLTMEFAFNSQFLQPVTLATQAPVKGSKGLVAGWGQLSEFEMNFDDGLKSVEVPILDLKECREAYFWTNVNEWEFCAGYLQGGVDTCQGDAGSPLLVKGQMVGIVSWGYGCARRGNPGVYTNVVMLREWIEQYSTITIEFL
ncbi:trypsin eta-like [Musca vetustissima]|uniref:trypsin eta-like n=1 Tax=Musca vetustissima TaxID=27455 RepID=UPI002AB6E1D9|nr:trypsin eta-like [Musca vetustissima]